MSSNRKLSIYDEEEVREASTSEEEDSSLVLNNNKEGNTTVSASNHSEDSSVDSSLVTPVSLLKSRSWYILNQSLHANFVSDDLHSFQFRLPGFDSVVSLCLLDSIEAVRFTKFGSITFLSILFLHRFLRWMVSSRKFINNVSCTFLKETFNIEFPNISVFCS